MKIQNYRHTRWFNWIAKFLYQNFYSHRFKEFTELIYWKIRKWKEKKLNNNFYEYFYTVYFDLDEAFYHEKKILDIGCGPRGSLEWANMTAERYGLDPLANQYLKLGADQHQMTYINAPSEEIPFPDAYFDVVTSFNSLDHVDDLERAIHEIKRIVKPNGLFLLIADIHDQPTLSEPSAFSWDIIQKFAPDFITLEENHYEGSTLYGSIRRGLPFDHNNPAQRYGVITAKLQRK